MEEKALHTLIPLSEFKAVLGMDDREDALSRYCLITASYTIEQYCKRRLICKKNTDYLSFTGEYIFTLREYPVRKILAVHVQKIRFPADFLNCSFCEAKTTPKALVTPPSMAEQPEIIEPGFYHTIPDCGDLEDVPFSLVLRPPLRLSREEMSIRVRYTAGYVPGKVGTPGGVPADLASACLERAAWNMGRYRGRRIGISGVVRGRGADGEHLETTMPENVKALLEPYQRKII
jgi:hypothetical protein